MTRKQIIIGIIFAYPVILLMVVFHEIGHILAAYLTGNKLLSVHIHTIYDIFPICIVEISKFTLFIACGGILVEIIIISFLLLTKFKNKYYFLTIGLLKVWTYIIVNLFTKTYDWYLIYNENLNLYNILISIVFLLSILSAKTIINKNK